MGRGSTVGRGDDGGGTGVMCGGGVGRTLGLRRGLGVGVHLSSHGVGVGVGVGDAVGVGVAVAVGV